MSRLKPRDAARAYYVFLLTTRDGCEGSLWAELMHALGTEAVLEADLVSRSSDLPPYIIAVHNQNTSTRSKRLSPYQARRRDSLSM